MSQPDTLDDLANRPSGSQQLIPAFTRHEPPAFLVHGPQTIIAPRDMHSVRRDIAIEAQAAGDDWFYSIPFKDRKTGKVTHVEGPSVDLATFVAMRYGAQDTDCWVSGEGPDFIEFTARFIDLQTGSAMTLPFRQRKGASRVGTDEGRNNEITFAIGRSKAIRNVIEKALPTLCTFAFREARNALISLVEGDPERWRREVSERIAQIVDIRRVEAVIGRPVKDWLVGDIAKIAAMGKAIREGMATIDESFPPLQRETRPSGDLDQFANRPVEKGQPEAAPSGQAAAKPTDGVPHNPGEAAADDVPMDKDKAIRIFLSIAGAYELPPNERAKGLRGAMNKRWNVDTKDLAGVFDVAMQVVNGELTPEEAEAKLK
jgi:hypothetical protein